MVDLNDIRTINGTNNQIDEDGESLGEERDNGNTGAHLIRLFDPAFDDGINEPRGGGVGGEESSLPNPREISNAVAAQGDVTGNPLNASDWLWQWGQFLDHDLGLSEGTNILQIENEAERSEANVEIPIPEGDILRGDNFRAIPVSRIPAVEGTGKEDRVREVENEVTAYIDGSNGYGSTGVRAAAKRTDLGNSFFGEYAEGEIQTDEEGRRFVEVEIEEEGEENVELVGSEAEEDGETQAPRLYFPPEGESPYDGKLLVANDSYGTDGLPFESGSDPTNTSGEILAPYNRADSPNADPDPDPDPNTEGRVPNDEEFISGDVRINEQSGLISIHTLFIREHNQVADKVAFHLDAGDDEALNDTFAEYRENVLEEFEDASEEEIRGEFIYEASRAIVGAKNQVITYEEFLPLLVGNESASDLEVIDEEILSPAIAAEFSGAAYRLGHTLLSDQIRTVDGEGLGSISLREAFFTPQSISANGVDDILIGLNYQQSNDADTRVIDGVRNNLFGPPGAGGLDLVAINIQRGRELGLPGYVEVYNQLNPDAPIEDFDDLDEIFGAELSARFESVYENVDQIDLWIGGLGEMPAQEGALLGPTLGAIVSDQFARLRDYDRFFYEVQLEDEDSFLSVVDNAINSDVGDTRLADVIRNNVANPELVPDDAFTVPFTNEIIGTVNSDRNSRRLVGTSAADLIDGKSGNDEIRAGRGDDIIFGGAGNDSLFGERGTDTLVGGAGNDVLEGATGDVFDGGTGNDRYNVILTDNLLGTQIADEGGSSDRLEFRALSGVETIEPSLNDFQPGSAGLKKSGLDLLIDLNQDGVISTEDDLTITNYFDEDGEAGSGVIEQIGELESTEIIDYFNTAAVIDGSNVYRFSNDDNDLFRYTTDQTERRALRANPDFDGDGITFVTAPEGKDLDALTGAKPVYAFTNEDNGSQLFTIDGNEVNTLLNGDFDLVFEGVVFYAYNNEIEGTEAVYRFFNAEEQSYFYTASASERQDFIEDPDFVREGDNGIAFYVPEEM
ncbi:MAG: peroxidase family protein [Cyanobacteria bacterium P01_C01_bin.72]